MTAFKKVFNRNEINKYDFKNLDGQIYEGEAAEKINDFYSNIIFLNQRQIDIILEKFETETQQQAHKKIWKKRQYSPMNIYHPEFEQLRSFIQEKFESYAIMFDVVFESSGICTDWHCDYESLGPFIIDDNYKSIKNSHFVSIHFNITEDGGSLVTLHWKYLSYLYNFITVWFGIFSPLHIFANFVFYPIFYFFGKHHSNFKGLGNVFDNMRLHSVTSGSPRISYVVRMAKKNSVKISKRSIETGIKRSDACLAFKPLLTLVGDDPVFSSQIPWKILCDEKSL